MIAMLLPIDNQEPSGYCSYVVHWDELDASTIAVTVLTFGGAGIDHPFHFAAFESV